MIDTALANKFKVGIPKIHNCYSVFNELVFYRHVENHKLTDADKYMLNNLLENVKDDTDYEYPLQKLYVYMIILFSNFISEGIFLDLDEEYMNIVIKVLLNTNIIEELFKML